MEAAVSRSHADLVCEGGGVRGIGLVGAVDALCEAGYRFPRVAGSSAGSVVASLVAALQAAGEPLSRLAEIMRTIDYRKFLDRSVIGEVPLIGGALSLLVSDGVYRGAYLERLLAGLLADLGVRTFGDLRTGEEPDQFAWSLVVTASDLSRRRLVRIPWDLGSYGIDPDDFPVARAVHASSAIPYVFEPVRVGGATWVDGGLLSDFPVELFDRPDAQPRWPTFGIRLSARPGMNRRDRDTGEQPGQRIHRRSVHRTAHHLCSRRRGQPHRLRHHRRATRRPVSTRIAGGPTVSADLELPGLPGRMRRPGERRALAESDSVVTTIPARSGSRADDARPARRRPARAIGS